MDPLYREYILDHYKNPRNFGELEERDSSFRLGARARRRCPCR